MAPYTAAQFVPGDYSVKYEEDGWEFKFTIHPDWSITGSNSNDTVGGVYKSKGKAGKKIYSGRVPSTAPRLHLNTLFKPCCYSITYHSINIYSIESNTTYPNGVGIYGWESTNKGLIIHKH